MRTEAMGPHRAPSLVSRASQGFSLVEMMVAMTIGLVLVGAGIAVYSNSRAAYTVNESVSRLQENARYALEEITRDLRLAGYWGLNSSAALVQNQNSLSVASDCSPQWYTRLTNRVEGSDGANTGYACIPDVEYQPGTDILAMRFVDPTPVVTLEEDNTPYLRSNRSTGRLFLGDDEPGGLADAQNYKLESRAYYIGPGDGALALKRVVFDQALIREVVVSGVENLQVQYALDVDGDRSVDRYVNAAAGTPWSQVEAVRLWLLVRAPTREAGYTNTTSYPLPQAPVTPNDGFRRVLVTKTVHLHN